jgi:sulfoxide reductase heme-binding subunit YedZ
MRRLSPNILRLLTHVGVLLPLAVLIWDGMHGGLTVNPIQEISARTGKTALVLLVLSLACTPLNTLFGLRHVLPLRRPLGLYAFAYAALHLLNFAAVDYGLDPVLLREAILEKRYVLVGFAAFLLLLPLAITSTTGFQRRLGKQWKQLHRLVYLAAILAVVHFVWLVKADVREPLVYGAIVGGLLVVRLPSIRRRLTRLRQSGRFDRTARRESMRSPQVEDSSPGLPPDNDLASSPDI